MRKKEIREEISRILKTKDLTLIWRLVQFLYKHCKIDIVIDNFHVTIGVMSTSQPSRHIVVYWLTVSDFFLNELITVIDECYFHTDCREKINSISDNALHELKSIL